MLHVVDVGSPFQPSPRRGRMGSAASAALHTAFGLLAVLLARPVTQPLQIPSPPELAPRDQVRHVVFLPPPTPNVTVAERGGGGGGNRQSGPTRRAESRGRDDRTVRVATPASPTGTANATELPGL